MKKTFLKIGLLLLVLSSIPALALAQNAPVSQDKNPLDLLPSNTDIVYDLKTTQPNPLEDAVVQEFKNAMSHIGTTPSGVEDLVEKIIKDTEVVFALQVNPEMLTGNTTESATATQPNYYAFVKVSADDFTKIMSNFDKTPKDTYRNTTWYHNDNTFFTYINGWVITANNEANLKKMIDAALDGNSNNISSLADYQKVASNKLNNSFLDMYINPQFVATMNQNQSLSTQMGIYQGFLKGMFKDDIYKLAKAEGISVAYNNNGFDFSMTVQGDKDALQKVGLSYNKYNFVPGLYKDVSGNNLILYGEKSNASARLSDTLSLVNWDNATIKEIVTGFNSWRTNFEKESGINLQNDVLSLFTKRDLVAVHNSNQLYPAVTLVMEVNDSQKAGGVLTKFVDYLKKHFTDIENKTGKKFVTFNTPSINGTSFYEFQFDIAKLVNSTEFSALPANMTTLYLRMAVTNDGLLVVSNHPDLGSIFRKDSGILQDQTVASKLTNMDEEVESVNFINFGPLHDYVKNLMTVEKAPSESQDQVDNFLKAFGTLSAKAYSSAPENMVVKGRLEVDAETLGKAFASIVGNIGLTREETNLPPQPITTEDKIFCDVESTNENYEAINTLKDQNVITGYPDGCFHPEKEVNRAEFATMVMRAISGKRALSEAGDKAIFADVKPGSWYFDKVNQASANKFINGFGNGTFGPEKTITRAQALQMLYNASPVLQNSPMSQDQASYSDVKTNDWFYKALVAANNEGLLAEVKWGFDGKFMPNEKVTRAEAVALLAPFMDLDNSTIQPARPEQTPGTNASTRLTQEGYSNMQNDFTPIKIATPDNVTKKSEATMAGNYVVTYDSSLDLSAACEAQSNYLDMSVWKPADFSPTPIISEGNSWAQMFTNGKILLTLACEPSPLEKGKTVVTFTETALVNIQNY